MSEKNSLKLDKNRVVRVGLAFVIVMVFWEVYDFAVPILLERTYGLSSSWRGLIMGLDNILAVVLLPLFGSWSDRTKGKFMGRRTPFIIIGTLLAGILVIIMVLIENAEFNKLVAGGITDIDTLVKNGYLDAKYLDPIYQNITAESELFQSYNEALNSARSSMALNNTIKHPASIACFIGVLLLLLISMSSFRSPAVAIMPDIVPKPLRASGNAIINFMGGVGGFISIGLYSLFAPEYGSYVTLFLLLTACMYVFLFLYVYFVDENKFVAMRSEEERKFNIVDEEECAGNARLSRGKVISLILILTTIFFWFMGYNAVRSHLSVYATSVLNMNSAGVGMINFANGLGGAIALFPVGWLSTKIGRKKSTLIGMALAVIAFIPCLFVSVKTSYLLGIFFVIAGIGLIIVNVNTLPMVVELSRGSNVGRFTGYYYVATMAAQAISPFLAGLIMENTHDNYMFVFAAVSIAIGFAVMCCVKHGDSVPTKAEVKENMYDN